MTRCARTWPPPAASRPTGSASRPPQRRAWASPVPERALPPIVSVYCSKGADFHRPAYSEKSGGLFLFRAAGAEDRRQSGGFPKFQRGGLSDGKTCNTGQFRHICNKKPRPCCSVMGSGPMWSEAPVPAGPAADTAYMCRKIQTGRSRSSAGRIYGCWAG